MINIHKSFSQCGDDYDEIESKNINHDFIDEFNDLTDDNKNNLSRKNTLKSTELSGTEKSNVESYLLEGQVVTKEIKDSKNFICKYSLLKKNEIKMKEKFCDTPCLLIKEIIVNDKLFAVYEELINYTFFIKYYSLKEIKNTANFINGIREVNKPYLDKKVADSSYFYIFNVYLPYLRVFYSQNPPNDLYNIS